MQLKQSGYFHAGICVYIIMVNKQIWPDEIQPIENLTFVPVESTYVKVFIARLVLVYIIFMACALIIPLLADLGIGWEVIAVECALAAAFVINLALVRKIYDIRGYALRDKDISYRRGVFFTSVTTIPFSKIQQVSVRMNPISRIFGLYYIDIINGSQSTMNRISIPGLTHEKAEKMKSLLINKADCAND